MSLQTYLEENMCCVRKLFGKDITCLVCNEFNIQELKVLPWPATKPYRNGFDLIFSIYATTTEELEKKSLCNCSVRNRFKIKISCASCHDFDLQNKTILPWQLITQDYLIMTEYLRKLRNGLLLSSP